MTVRHSLGLIVMLLTACSADQPTAPTEQNLHAGDSGPAGAATHHHVFVCPGQRSLLVDFANGGLTLRIRDDPSAAPLVMTAPAQGARFAGDGGQAIIADRELRLDLADGTRRRCTRQTEG